MSPELMVRALVACGVVLASLPPPPAQPTRPDFSGTWLRDAARSEHYATAEKIEIEQSADEIRLRGFLCCRQQGEVWTTTYSFNQWGPRSATPAHMPANVVRRDEKPTQARWDGDTLVLHAGPDLDTRGGSVRLWQLASNGRDLLEEVVNRGLGRSFDFKARSIPAYYARDRHVYVRQ